MADIVKRGVTKEMERPNLGQILHDYQVPEGQMVAYYPRLLGKVDIPFAGPHSITKGEAEMLDQLTFERGLLGLSNFSSIRDEAFNESRERYVGRATPPPEMTQEEGVSWIFNDGHRDAFRHAYWNALMTREYGEEWANKFASLHEGVPGSQYAREAMDLYNNEVGRRIAVENPDATKEQLAELVQGAAVNGNLLVLDKEGNLAWSDQIAIGKHGTAKEMSVKQHQGIEMHSDRGRSMQDASTDERANLDPRVTSIYQACSKGVDALDAQMGRGSDQASACMKASLAHLAVANGLERVDHVLLSQQASGVSAGQHVFVVQGDPANPAHLRAHMPTEIAVKTPEETSLREMALAANAPARQAELSQQQEEVLRRAQPSQAGLG